jgi:translation initiation factor 2-alpha kinase 4
LKPSNVFLDSFGNAKIGDFGLATIRIDSKALNRNKLLSDIEEHSLTSDIGTPIYIAPEILGKNVKYSYKVDMFSLGILYTENIHLPEVL